MKKDNKYKKAIIGTIFISLIVYLLIIGGIFIFARYDLITKIGLSEQYDWLRLLASSGSTLVAVIVPVSIMFYTLFYQKEQDEIDRRLQILPRLSYNIITDESRIPKDHPNSTIICIPAEEINYDNYKDTESSKLLIRIKNVGNWHLRGMRIYLETDHVKAPYNYNVWEGADLNQDQELEVYYQFEVLPKIKDAGSYRHSVHMHIYYQDMAHNFYKQTLEFSITKSIANPEEVDRVYHKCVCCSDIGCEKIVQGYPETNEFQIIPAKDIRN